MNRRKLIYFLSAFVLIIGCYALNLSYSLFTQNITTENNVVESTIPVINASLEQDTFTIPANSGELLTLKINNTGNTNIQFGVSIPTLPEGIKGYLVEKADNDIVGTLESNTNKEVLVYIENENAEDIEVIFNLDVKYETITFDKESFINSSNIDCVNKIKLLYDSILARAASTEITDETRTILDESFDSSRITGISGETERKLIKAEDDYGTSYVYRGAVKDNYVNFAGFTWRIVRINGDGTIRLILDGTLDKTCVEYNTDKTCKTYAGTTTEFNISYNDNAYVGYMYGFTGGVTSKCLTKGGINEYTVDSSSTYTSKEVCESAGGRWAGTAYETTHINKNSSTIKTNIDTFYETYIENGTTKQYEKYLSDTIFCGDKSLSSSGIGNVSTQLGYGTGSANETYYAGSERLYHSSGLSSITTANPTLKCAEGESNTYSRYTVEEQNRNNVLTNGDLKHPIALLSADELVLAGAWGESGTFTNQSYYLYDAYANVLSYSYWWTLTPYNFSGSSAIEYSSNATTYSLGRNSVYSSGGARPVINLRNDVLIESGNGTKQTTYDEDGNVLTGPYIIK